MNEYKTYISSDVYLADNKEVFQITLLNEAGDRRVLTSEHFTLTKKDEDRFVFRNEDAFDGQIVIDRQRKNGDVSLGLSVENHSECIIESVKFPVLEIPCKLQADGGDDLIFWPSLEGTLTVPIRIINTT